MGQLHDVFSTSPDIFRECHGEIAGVCSKWRDAVICAEASWYMRNNVLCGIGPRLRHSSVARTPARYQRSVYELMVQYKQIDLETVVHFLATCRDLYETPLSCALRLIGTHINKHTIFYVYNSLFMTHVVSEPQYNAVITAGFHLNKWLKWPAVPTFWYNTRDTVPEKYYPLVLFRLSRFDPFAKHWFIMHMIEEYGPRDAPMYRLRYTKAEFNMIMTSLRHFPDWTLIKDSFDVQTDRPAGTIELFAEIESWWSEI